MDFRTLIEERGGLSGPQFLSIGVLILVIAGGGYFYWTELEKEKQLYPAQISAEVRPGAVVLLPISRKLTADNESGFVINGILNTQPDQLPGGVSIIQSRVDLRRNAAKGHVLVWAPKDVSGQARFSLAASGKADAAQGDSAEVRSLDVRVNLSVRGAPMPDAKPSLAGVWFDDDQVWRFAADGSEQLTITDRNGDSAIDFQLYPDLSGRWFLLEMDVEQPRLYWLEIDGEVMRVAMPGTAFEEVAQLQRS